jgi:polyhydroxybutyrate depolymerase
MRVRSVACMLSVLVACAMATAACSSTSGSTRSAPSGAVPHVVTAASVKACHRPHPAGQYSQTLTVQGKHRTYQLYVPAAYTGTKRVPLVFNFHGFGSNALQEMLYADFKPQADTNDFLIVAPDGQGSPGGRHFSFGGEPGLQNDVTMVSALLGRLRATLCVDASRVYSTGMSDGGAMTSVLACALPDKFAAFAAVAVIIYCGSKAKRTVPIEAFSGTADPVVPFKGGAVHCCGGTLLAAPTKAMADWAAHNRCRAKFTDTRLGSEVRRRTWKSCAPGSNTVFYIIDGGGHTWPGAISITRLGFTTHQIKASAVIWKFFSAHQLPA